MFFKQQTHRASVHWKPLDDDRNTKSFDSEQGENDPKADRREMGSTSALRYLCAVSRRQGGVPTDCTALRASSSDSDVQTRCKNEGALESQAAYSYHFAQQPGLLPFGSVVSIEMLEIVHGTISKSPFNGEDEPLKLVHVPMMSQHYRTEA